MDQGWIKSRHIRDDVLGPFSASRMAIGGRHRASKRSKMAINSSFVAISKPGGPKLVDQRGSRLDQVQAHPGRCDGQFTASRMAIGGRHRASKRPEMAINGHIVAISRPGGPKLVDQRGSRLDQVQAHPSLSTLCLDGGLTLVTCTINCNRALSPLLLFLTG